ncbi:hypothetical protein CSOJ01_09995 [Colletotrichum sojae]|uniref:Uncharacterized protein n=1 Tax=Colletotrichum sojae TaxID=2175907 RepID=A0A8H6MQP4_9PEZI|nr:hypothetical protein CSOJ01_09995 [Colletotrichum sojae]
MRPVIWNGQYKEKSCLRDYAENGVRTEWSKTYCPNINLDIKQQADDGEPVYPCGASGSGSKRVRQESGGSCPLFPPFEPGGGGDSGEAHTVTFTSGSTPSPTCSSAGGCGGHVCTGYYCTPNPTGNPPDHHDPKDPNGGSSVPTKTIEEPSGPTDPPNTCNDKCKLDKGNACDCDENSCTADSPGCCANASCPMCECGESGCTSGSPACCGSGTCKWSWTGGGGGDGTGKPPGDGGGSPPPSDPPPTKPAARQIVFALSEMSFANPVGPWTWSRDWLVFSSEPGRQINMCRDKSVYSEDTSTPAAMVGYPPSMEFDVVDGLKCSYEGDEKNIGTLKCPGVTNMKCEGIDVFVGCVSNNPTMSGRLYCYWS